MDWSGVDYCDVFISCLDSHSDGTHSLMSIHCWDTDAVTFLQTWWRNKLILISDDLRESTFSCWHHSETEVRMNIDTNPLVAVDRHAVRDVELSESLSFLSVHPQHLQIWHTNQCVTFTHLCMNIFTYKPWFCIKMYSIFKKCKSN